MVDGIRPVFQAFSDRGLSPLLGRMIHDIYSHYPEPNARYYHADGSVTPFASSGIRRYEPTLIEIFEEGYLLDLGAELASILQTVELEEEVEPQTMLENLLIHINDEEAGVQNRHGETTATRGDGTPTTMTRFYVLVEGMDAMDEWLAADAEADAAWERASDELVDLMLDTVEVGDGRGAFEDPGSGALGAIATEHLYRHLKRHEEAGDLFARIRADYPDYVEDIITSRALAAAVELFREVRTDEADQALFDDFMIYLTAPNEDNTLTALALAYELMMAADDQVGYPLVAPFLSNLVDPERRGAEEYPGLTYADLPLLTHGAMSLSSIFDVDPDSIGIELLRRGLAAPEGGESPVSILGRVIRQIHRLEPGAAATMSVADKAKLYTSLYDFIRDDFSGFERLVDIIQTRHGE